MSPEDAEIALRRARVSYMLELSGKELVSLYRLVSMQAMSWDDERQLVLVRKKLEDLWGAP